MANAIILTAFFGGASIVGVCLALAKRFTPYTDPKTPVILTAICLTGFGLFVWSNIAGAVAVLISMFGKGL